MFGTPFVLLFLFFSVSCMIAKCGRWFIGIGFAVLLYLFSDVFTYSFVVYDCVSQYTAHKNANPNTERSESTVDSQRIVKSKFCEFFAFFFYFAN